uniref:Uncharacterized protein n=1 Tax=Anguilla anguilla TaxID=7936 RepID=A0A0E9PXZ2_ANGAN
MLTYYAFKPPDEYRGEIQLISGTQNTLGGTGLSPTAAHRRTTISSAWKPCKILSNRYRDRMISNLQFLNFFYKAIRNL